MTSNRKSKFVTYKTITCFFNSIKVEVKVNMSLCFEHHAMKAYWGSGGTAPCILDLGTRWR
jgi:hypothetical protein